MMFSQLELEDHPFNNSFTESFYMDSNSKEDLNCEDETSSGYSCSPGSESPRTLTDLTDVGAPQGCITGNGNAFLNADDSGYGDKYWSDSSPSSWDMWQAQSWLNMFSNTNAIDVTSFLGLTGTELCQLTLEHCMQRDSMIGGMIYHELQRLQYTQQSLMYPVQQNIHPNFSTDFEGGEALDSMGILLKAYSVTGCDTLPSLPPLAPMTSLSANVKVEKSPVKPTASVKPTVKQETSHMEEEDDMSPPSSPESTTSCVSSKAGGRRNSKGKGKLWEFIRDLLLDGETCPSIIRWENRSEGIFRIVKSDSVAKLWGKRKCNASMTYEKMSRAMRYYYKKGVLERIECRRLVYKFGGSSRGWQL